MPLFGDPEELDRALPKAIGAGALVTGALVAPSASNYVIDTLDKYVKNEQAGRTQVLDAKLRSELIDEILDKNLRNIPVVIDSSAPSSAFMTVNSNFAPDRKTALDAVEQGGVMLAGGEKLPMSKFIRDTRRLGGYVSLAPGDQYIPTLAHELGHATVLSPTETLRQSKIFQFLDKAGRNSLKAMPLVGGGAALAALSIDSDNPAKWAIPGALLATQLPMLYEEHVASKRGLEALLRLNKKKQVNEAAKLLEPLISPETVERATKVMRGNLGTYLAGTAGLLAAPLLAGKARSLIDSIRDE
jgi:hypothetical protein